MLRKTRKILRTTLSVLLIIFIVAWPIYNFMLGRNVAKDKNREDEMYWKGIITIWDYPRLNVETGSRYGWMTKKIKEFEKKHPGVYIKLEPIDWSTGPYKLEVGAKTGVLPDIAPVTSDLMFMDEDVLEPLDVYFTKDEIYQFKYQAIKSVTYDNKLWGVPCMMSTYGMYINLELFKQRGVDPPINGNWTYEEFVEKMKLLTYDSDNDGEVDQYGFISFIEPNYYNSWGIILSDGGEIIDENGNYTFYGDKAISGVKKLVDLSLKHKVTPEDFGVISENEAWDMFCKEQKVAVYPTGTWAVRVLERQYLKGEGFEFAVVNYPIGDSKMPIALSNSVTSYGIFKQQDKGKLDMCVEFLKFLTEDKNQKNLYVLGVFPVKKGIGDLYSDNINMQRFESSLAYTQILPRHTKWKEIDRILQTQIRMAIIGEKTSQEALDDAKIQIQQLLQ